jgi:dimeric dUTPase (all-alpha-NTP-PPase superfamily)
MFLYAVQSEKALSISQEIILLAHLLKCFRFSENEKEINKNHLKHHFADFLL